MVSGALPGGNSDAYRQKLGDGLVRLHWGVRLWPPLLSTVNTQWRGRGFAGFPMRVVWGLIASALALQAAQSILSHHKDREKAVFQYITRLYLPGLARGSLVRELSYIFLGIMGELFGVSFGETERFWLEDSRHRLRDLVRIHILNISGSKIN